MAPISFRGRYSSFPTTHFLISHSPCSSTDNTKWSDWVHTVRTSTGTWAVAFDKEVCSTSIVNIECRHADGSPLAQAPQVVHCKPLIGFYCRNREQVNPEEKCKDYKFRFLCSNIPKPGE